MTWNRGWRVVAQDGATGRLAVPGFMIAFVNLGMLGLLIGWEGASRAYSVGLHTLFRDVFPAVVVTNLTTVLLAAIVGRRLRRLGELGWLIGLVLVADVIAALGVVLAIGEITLVDTPRAVITETALGSQLAAACVGGLIGYASKRGSPTRGGA